MFEINFISIRYLSILVLGFCFFSRLVFGQECCEEETIPSSCETARPEERISLSHVEGTGLGYSIGYSSLDLFVSSYVKQGLVTFLDLRGHVFNNGKYAANTGLGVRYLNECFRQVWGVNVVYDYLQNTRRSYHQVGAGLEMIGETWDFHVNGYVPVGDKKTNIYRFHYGFFEAFREEKPSKFKLGLRAREQLALNGVDALFGYRFCCAPYVNLHISAGPYYYWGRTAKTENAFAPKYESAIGGRLIADLYFTRYVNVTGIVTYDSIFNLRGQAMITLNLPFDLICGNWGIGCPSCSLRDRLFDPIERNEIIVVDSLTRTTNDPRVLDPEFQP